MDNADTNKAIANAGWPRIVFYLLQFTWGSTVNLAGLLVFLCCRSRFHSKMFHNAIVTYLPGNRGGLSLGVFIFLSIHAPQESSRLCVHEYGHTVQCLFLGPLYWVAVAIPSVIWYHCFAGYRKSMEFHTTRFFANAGLPYGANSGVELVKNCVTVNNKGISRQRDQPSCPALSGPFRAFRRVGQVVGHLA